MLSSFGINVLQYYWRFPVLENQTLLLSTCNNKDYFNLEIAVHLHWHITSSHYIPKLLVIDYISTEILTHLLPHHCILAHRPRSSAVGYEIRAFRWLGQKRVREPWLVILNIPCHRVHVGHLGISYWGNLLSSNINVTGKNTSHIYGETKKIFSQPFFIQNTCLQVNVIMGLAFILYSKNQTFTKCQ